MSDLIKYETAPALAFSNDEIAIFKQSYAQELNAVEFKLFIRTCQVRGLQPGRHLVANVFSKRDPEKRKLVWITTKDGALSIAESTGEYDGTTEPTLLVETDPSEDLLEVPHSRYDPVRHKRIVSATAGVKRKGFSDVVYGTAVFKSFAKSGPGDEIWKRHPDLMIVKCALMQALRNAFPDKIGGLYDSAEMHGMEGGAIDVEYQRVEPEDNQATTEEAVDAPPPVDNSTEAVREALHDPDKLTDIDKDIIKGLEYWQALGREEDSEKIAETITLKMYEAFGVAGSAMIDPNFRKDVQKWLKKDARFHLEEAGLIEGKQ